MKLKDLKDMGGFVSSAPVAVDVTWNRPSAEPVTFTVHIRKHSFGTIEKLLNAVEDDRSRSAAYLSESVLLGDGGKEPLKYEDAYQLDPSLAAALAKAVNEVNATGGGEKN